MTLLCDLLYAEYLLNVLLLSWSVYPSRPLVRVLVIASKRAGYSVFHSAVFFLEYKAWLD